MTVGIYSLVCNETGKRYVGQSTNIEKRRTDHFCALRNQRHPNRHLQNAWDNGQTFRFELIEECAPEECNDREIFWIAEFDSMQTGYNQCKGGEATLGRVCSEETKKKISEKNKGRKVSDDVIRRRKETFRRRLAEDPDFAEAHRRKLSERLKGKPSWNKGIKRSAEVNARVSEKLKGRVITEEHKAKLRELYSGEKSLTAKLTAVDVANIRYRYLCGERQMDIAKDYPVTAQTIYDIVRGRRWKSVPNNLAELEMILSQEA